MVETNKRTDRHHHSSLETARQRRAKRLEHKSNPTPTPMAERRERQRSSSKPVKAQRVRPVTPPVLIRSNFDGMPATTGNKTTPRRRYDVALGTAGAEMRLPSFPIIHVGWRLASSFLVVMIVAGLFFLWKSPMFRITSVEMDGLERLSANDINIVTGVFGESIFVADTDKITDDLQRAFPELASIGVQVKLPAEIKITVIERQPVIGWLVNNTENWVDENGVLFPARGEVEGLVIVEAMDDFPSPKQVTDDELDEIVNQIKLPQSLVNAVIKLSEVVPEGTRLRYDSEHGLGWYDPNGWEIYFGRDNQDIEQKISIYQALIDHLASEGITPTYISVEYLHAPFYRMEH